VHARLLPTKVTQHEATSKDGTKIPYFQVSRANIPLDGSNPTLLYGCVCRAMCTMRYAPAVLALAHTCSGLVAGAFAANMDLALSCPTFDWMLLLFLLCYCANFVPASRRRRRV
jgi:hypothetical protein